MTSVVAFVVVLGVLIFFHELGHFLFAKLFGVGVEKFSLGFGPRLFGKTVGITDYRVSAIPLGGYVKMVGEEPDAEIEPEDIPISFTHKHVFKRMLIVAAGPFFNFLLAVIIFFCIFLISGAVELKPNIGEVKEGTPAHRAKIQKGDIISGIDGKEIGTWNEMADIISGSKGKSLAISVTRENSVFVVNIAPEVIHTKNIFGEDTERYVIGITSSGETFSKDMNLFQAMSESMIWTYRIAELTILSIVKMIRGTVSTETLGGPIMIAQLAGERAESGTASLVFFIAVLSVNLAILNFLPIPILDGGHLLFFSIEAMIGRPLNTRMREIAQQMGLAILLLLMIFVFYNDIKRVFFS
ncbi:MAG: RIP metalloprotease RseP [Desulfobacteraceae bacterium 4572_88]|nr:MAG: RIP metalloprotease RseP [Desulfobacteraceae bacterium 4572_88]